MKHPKIGLAILLIAAMGCRKTRTCDCVVKTTGTVTTHSQTQGLDPILPASDTTTYYPYEWINTRKSTNQKVTRKAMRAECPVTTEEGISEVSVNAVPGLFTVTTTDIGKRTTTCEIE